MDIEEIFRYCRLIDFYGSALTDKQLEVAKLFFFDNISLSEIGEVYGTTRQATYDLVRRIKKILDRYERIIGTYRKYIKTDELIAKLDKQLNLANTSESIGKKFDKIWEG